MLGHNNVHACTMTVFILFPPHKFRLTLYFLLLDMAYFPYLRHTISYPWTMSAYDFYYYHFSVYIYSGFEPFFVWSNLNHISNNQVVFLMDVLFENWILFYVWFHLYLEQHGLKTIFLVLTLILAVLVLTAALHNIFIQGRSSITTLVVFASNMIRYLLDC